MKRTANNNFDLIGQKYLQALLNLDFPKKFERAASALLVQRGWIDFVEMEREMTVFDAEPSQTGVQVVVGWDFFVEAESFLTYTLNLLKMPRFDLGSAERKVISVGASMEGGSGSRGAVQASLYLAPLA